MGFCQERQLCAEIIAVPRRPESVGDKRSTPCAKSRGGLLIVIDRIIKPFKMQVRNKGAAFSCQRIR